MRLKVDVWTRHPFDRVATANSRRVPDSLSQLTGIGAAVHGNAVRAAAPAGR